MINIRNEHKKKFQKHVKFIRFIKVKNTYTHNHNLKIKTNIQYKHQITFYVYIVFRKLFIQNARILICGRTPGETWLHATTENFVASIPEPVGLWVVESIRSAHAIHKIHRCLIFSVSITTAEYYKLYSK